MFDVLPVPVQGLTGSPPWHFSDFDRSKFALVDADSDAVAGARPLIVDMAQQLQGASTCAVPRSPSRISAIYAVLAQESEITVSSSGLPMRCLRRGGCEANS